MHLIRAALADTGVKLLDATTMQDASRPQVWRRRQPDAPCCSRRLRAWICSRTTRIGPTSLWKRCVSWRLLDAGQQLEDGA